MNALYQMKAWENKLRADGNVGDEVAFYADPDASFTEFMGETLDLNAAGLGPGLRSNRYAAVINNGKVEFFNAEDSAGDHEVSTADAVLASL